ncbi:hypothetical protein [Paenibacillus illinoisensis]|uniref:Uncharacterized protein n=1 Tax=Paenibacillus illinoisensis TaxID=59845 RepID=A0A2W0C8J3_9BACL|nr:hypothetical protein [Paenibacillus illinoisensis]PYY28367.1 Uncharacterized protein PIL02S_03518 [Paenibacillus illinoisensis]
MKIYNYQLEQFIIFLHSLELERRASRMRTRLKNKLVEQMQRITEEALAIDKEYYCYDENNQPIVENNKYQFKNFEARNQDILELTNEFFIIEQNEANKEMLLSVKDSVLNHSPSTFKGADADIYDGICELVEQIKYE